LTRTIKEDLITIGDGIANVQKEQKEQKELATTEKRLKIENWLSPPDPSSNHHAACKTRQPTTGEWFINSEEFKNWKINSRSFLWLSGIRK
jgi:hypothetical protein